MSESCASTDGRAFLRVHTCKHMHGSITGHLGAMRKRCMCACVCHVYMDTYSFVILQYLADKYGDKGESFVPDTPEVIPALRTINLKSYSPNLHVYGKRPSSFDGRLAHRPGG